MRERDDDGHLPWSGNFPELKRFHGPAESLRRTGFSRIHLLPNLVSSRAALHVRCTQMLATLAEACSRAVRRGSMRMCTESRTGLIRACFRNLLTVKVLHGTLKRPLEIFRARTASMSALYTSSLRMLSRGS